MKPEDIIEAIDQLPTVDQSELLDAIMPNAEGSYGDSRLSRLHRMVDTFSQLREDIGHEAIHAVFDSPERLRSELEAYADGRDSLVDFAVRVILDLDHDAVVSRGTIAQAAKNLLDECATRDLARASTIALDVDIIPEDMYQRAYEAVEAVEEHLHAHFEWNGKHDDMEQVRPWMPAFLRAFDEVKTRDGFAYDDAFKGKVYGIAGTSHESRGIYLLQGLKRRDEHRAKVEALRADGFVEWVKPKPGQRYAKVAVEDMASGYVFGRFPEVAVCTEGGSTGGGDRISRYADARIVLARVTRSDVQLAIMKPRQRVNGVSIPYGATIFIKAAGND